LLADAGGITTPGRPAMKTLEITRNTTPLFAVIGSAAATARPRP
jgi:hypothetical protein